MPPKKLAFQAPKRVMRPSRMLRKFSRRAQLNKLQRQVHMFKRIWASPTPLTASFNPATGGSPAQAALAFKLSDLLNVDEYKALYDQYKITGVAVRLIPKALQFQGTQTSTTGAIGYGQVVTAIDYDDQTVPGSKDQLLQYGSAKVTDGNKIHSRYFAPKILNQVYSSALVTAYAPKKAQYLDTVNDAVPHFGLKVWIDAPVIPATMGLLTSISYDVYVTYYFKCKNTR